MVILSLKIQGDDSFPRIINWKIHFRYFGSYILGSLSPPQKILFEVLSVETLPRLLKSHVDIFFPDIFERLVWDSKISFSAGWSVGFPILLEEGGRGGGGGERIFLWYNVIIETKDNR